MNSATWSARPCWKHSPPSATSERTLVIAHQTVNDLRNVPGDLDPEQVVSSVTENCGLKFSYRVNDPDTALWLARMSGNILVDDEVRSLEANTVLAERERDIRSLRQSERYSGGYQHAAIPAAALRGQLWQRVGSVCFYVSGTG